MFRTTHSTDRNETKMRPLFNGGLCAAWFTAAMGGAFAAESKLANVCAERDIVATTLIEERADSETVPSERLYQAFTTQINARVTCAAGRVGEALALYDRIENEVRTAGTGTTTR
jgi:hypothetical protein